MKLGWYATLLCESCITSSGARCSTLGCSMYTRDMGLRFGSDISVVPMTDAQFLDFEARQSAAQR